MAGRLVPLALDLTTWLLEHPHNMAVASPTKARCDVFYNLASEILHFHFYRIPLALVPSGRRPHKGMNTKRQRRLGASWRLATTGLRHERARNDQEGAQLG